MSILGPGEIAASLGTATGFITLGVAYALSEMIDTGGYTVVEIFATPGVAKFSVSYSHRYEDTVAGVYLHRDPDSNVDYQVSPS